MDIYLAGSIQGGREYENGLKLISNILTSGGHKILTPFVVEQELNRARFPNLSGRQRAESLFEEDIKLLRQADAVVAEVSTPSTGVGIELGFLVGMAMYGGGKKPTLGLWHITLKNERKSFLVEGNNFIRTAFYHELAEDDLRFLLNNFCSDAKKEIEKQNIGRERRK